MKIKLKIEAFGFKKGTVLEVSDFKGKRMVQDGDATEVVEKTRGRRPKVENKALSAKA